MGERRGGGVSNGGGYVYSESINEEVRGQNMFHALLRGGGATLQNDFNLSICYSFRENANISACTFLAC